MKYSVFRSRKAFTLVEVLVAVAMIVILVGLSIFVSVRYEQTARDTERDSKANVIASALEKYYDTNNEYPSCTSLTAAPATVKSNTLTTLTDDSALKAPRADAGVNSILCSTTVPTDTTTDRFVYTCTNTTTSCEEWELKYRKESNGQIVTISSTRTVLAAGEITPLAAPTVTVTASMAGPNAVGTASATCISGSPEFQMRSFKNSGTYGAWDDVDTQQVALNEGEDATFQAQARCVRSGFPASSFAQSAAANVVRPVSAPTGLTISGSVSGSSATANIGGGTCAVGTVIKRQIRSNTTNVAWGGSWTAFADIATTSQTQTVNQGWQYNFQHRAQCVNQTRGIESAWTDSDYLNLVRPIAAIGAPYVWVSTANNSTMVFSWHENGSACPYGTWRQWQWYRTGSWGGSFGWWGALADGERSSEWPDSSQGYSFAYQVQQRCVTDFTQSGWSGSGSASYYRDVDAPARAQGFSRDKISNAGIAFSWSAPACGWGTSHQWRLDFVNGGGTGIKWLNSPTGREDYWFYGLRSYDEADARPGTAWTTNWPSYGYMGDRNNTAAVNPPRMNLDAGTVGAWDSGNYFGVAVQYRCYNPTSGAVGPAGPNQKYADTWWGA